MKLNILGAKALHYFESSYFWLFLIAMPLSGVHVSVHVFVRICQFGVNVSVRAYGFVHVQLSMSLFIFIQHENKHELEHKPNTNMNMNTNMKMNKKCICKYGSWPNFRRQNVPRDKLSGDKTSVGLNIQGNKTSQGTKCRQGQNVHGEKHHWGKTSGGTKRPETKCPFEMFLIYKFKKN